MTDETLPEMLARIGDYELAHADDHTRPRFRARRKPAALTVNISTSGGDPAAIMRAMQQAQRTARLRDLI